MQKPRDAAAAARRDFIKLGCFVLALGAAIFVFFWTPSLTVPTLCAIVCSTLLSPWISALERRGFSRSAAILLLLAWMSASGTAAGMVIARNWNHEWGSFQTNVPDYFSYSIQKLAEFEAQLKASYPSLHNLKLAESVANWGRRQGEKFTDRLPSIVSSLFGSLFLVPILTFCFLNEGRDIRRRFAQLVPNRFFESVYIVTHGVGTALSDYLRAKAIEGFLVGAITAAGLGLTHSRYAIVLGVWAGLTNVAPYIGPFLGAAPGVLIALLDPEHGGTLGGALCVYGIANLIDSVLIFPGLVGKLVKLNPLVLTASVILGQYYGGLLGMLVSIPIAAALKVVLHEIYAIIYGYAAE